MDGALDKYLLLALVVLAPGSGGRAGGRGGVAAGVAPARAHACRRQPAVPRTLPQLPRPDRQRLGPGRLLDRLPQAARPAPRPVQVRLVVAGGAGPQAAPGGLAA